MKTGLLVIGLLAATAASAQPFKCTNEEGKTVYSDQRCDAMPKKAPAAPATPQSTKGGRYQPTEADLARIKALETQAEKAGVFSEQKTGLLLEASAIRSGVESRMSAADRAKREAIGTQLANKDVKVRTQALGDLRVLYGNQ